MPNPLSETVIDLYRRHAAYWDAARRGSDWNDRVWHQAFADELSNGSSVLDLGGGEPVARFLVEQGMRVTGVDSSPAMMALARERLPGQQWIVADMRCLALNRLFDGILAWDSYFHLAHEAQRAMFAVFDAHGGGDAVLMFNIGPEHGEAASTFTFKGEQLYHASPLRQRSTELCSIVAASKLCSTLLTMCEAVAGLLGRAVASGRADPSLFRWTLAIAEAVNDGTPRQAVKGFGIHVVTVQEVAAEGFVVPIECSAARPGVRTRHVLRDVMTGVEHERGVPFDADAADAEKQCASRLADAFDAKGLAAAIVLTDNSDEVRHIAPFGATG